MSRFLRKIRHLPGSSDMPATDKSEGSPASKKKMDRPAHGTATLIGSHSAAHESSIKGDFPSSSNTLSPPSTTNAKVDLISLQEKKMTGKKISSKERPDDNARQLASTLTLEEQVLGASFPPHRFKCHLPCNYGALHYTALSMMVNDDD